MSFLSRYWNAVERQHTETGMNHGDIRVDVKLLKENTRVSDIVDPQPTQPKPQTNRPIKDGSMPSTKFERGSARPYQRVQEMAEDTRPIREAKASRNRSVENERSGGSGTSGDQTKTTAREVKRLRNKALKKLGAGRKVNVQLDKVVIDGQSWHQTA
jgi:hypothetical protein